jgi:AcrR family transcriptional regulator
VSIGLPTLASDVPRRQLACRRPPILQFNHFLIKDDKPLLFHTGMRRMFPEVRDAVARPIDPADLRWISRSHFEVDECGAPNEWLAAAAENLFLTRGFEETTIEEIAEAAGVSRRTFFRYFESKEDVLAVHAERFGEVLYAALAARPKDEAPIVAIRNAIVPALEAGLRDRDVLRCTIRLLRETNSLRRVVLARRNRFEERVAALMTKRLRARASDNTPMLLAFLTRALLDSAFNAWYDHETKDVARLLDELIDRLRALLSETASTG